MTLNEAKAYLRLTTNDEDALVDRLVASATQLCEAFLGEVLVRREIVETIDAADDWRRLAAAPVAAVTFVEGQDEVGGWAALPIGAYAIDIDARGEGWVRAPGARRVRVTYQAGLATAPEGVPPAIAQGITRLAAHLYAHRDDGDPPPAAIAALWRPFRRLRLGLETRR